MNFRNDNHWLPVPTPCLQVIVIAVTIIVAMDVGNATISSYSSEQDVLKDLLRLAVHNSAQEWKIIQSKEVKNDNYNYPIKNIHKKYNQFHQMENENQKKGLLYKGMTHLLDVFLVGATKSKRGRGVIFPTHDISLPMNCMEMCERCGSISPEGKFEDLCKIDCIRHRGNSHRNDQCAQMIAAIYSDIG